MATILEQLRGMTTVVSDTGDINAIKQYKPTGSTTNPSLIQATAGMPEYQPIAACYSRPARTLEPTQPTSRSPHKLSRPLQSPLERRSSRSSPVASPPRSTPVSTTPRNPSRPRVTSSRSTKSAGISARRVLIKLASTWEESGRRAAREGRHSPQPFSSACTGPSPALRLRSP